MGLSIIADRKNEEDLLNFELRDLNLADIPDLSFCSYKESTQSQYSNINQFVNPTNIPSKISDFSEKPPKNPDSSISSLNIERHQINSSDRPLHKEQRENVPIRKSMSPSNKIDSKKKECSPAPIRKSEYPFSGNEDKGEFSLTPSKPPLSSHNVGSINKKKFNFKIATKFEQVVEGIKNGSLENVDLTGAGMILILILNYLTY